MFVGGMGVCGRGGCLWEGCLKGGVGVCGRGGCLWEGWVFVGGVDRMNEITHQKILVL